MSSNFLQVHVALQADIYDKKHAYALGLLYVQLLGALTTKEYDSIRDVNIFGSPDQEEFRESATGPVIQQPSQSIICRLSACVRTYPDRLAVRDRWGSQLTYHQLARRLSVLTTAMLAHGIGIGIPVGILGLLTTDLYCSHPRYLACWRNLRPH